MLDNAQFILGPTVVSFEHDFAACCGTSEVVALTRRLIDLAASRGADDVVTYLEKQ